MKSRRRRNDNRIKGPFIEHFPVIGKDFDACIFVQDAAQITRAVANSDQLSRRVRVDNRKMGESHFTEPNQTNVNHGGLPTSRTALNRPEIVAPARETAPLQNS